MLHMFDNKRLFIFPSASFVRKCSPLWHQLLRPFKAQLPPLLKDTISSFPSHNHLGRKCTGVVTCHTMTHIRLQSSFHFVPCWWLLCTAVQIPASLRVSRFLTFAKSLHLSSIQYSSRLFSGHLTRVIVCCASLLCWVTKSAKLH